jgi:hypothetical protein
MKAAVSRAGNAFSKIMGQPCRLSHDFREYGVVRMAADCTIKTAQLRCMYRDPPVGKNRRPYRTGVCTGSFFPSSPEKDAG